MTKFYLNRNHSQSKIWMMIITLAFTGFCSVTEPHGFEYFALPAAQARSPFGSLSEDNANRAYQAQQAGLSGDTTQIPAIMDLLHQPSQPDLHETAMLALARLGATQSLSLFDVVIQSKDYPDIAAFAVAARARLIAERAAQSAGTNQAANKVARFYIELNLSPKDLNAAAIDYQHYQGHKPAVDLSFGTNIGDAAIAELADMIYHDPAEDYTLLPGVREVNFESDPPSALKIRLAPLSNEKRIAAMIYDLTHEVRPLSSPLNTDEIQLLNDEGLPASHAAAAQLKAMELNRQDYKATAYGSMFSIMSNVGDKDQAPLIKHFKSDPDPTVAGYADQVYDSIVKGIQSRPVYGY
ncbi:MAG: hypothetical protein ACRYFS_21530 [Janthinobacterium lividum]